MENYRVKTVATCYAIYSVQAESEQQAQEMVERGDSPPISEDYENDEVIGVWKAEPFCKKCYNKVTKKKITKGYAYFCPSCDEDLYEFEVIFK